jgi:hypothetical protein
MPTPMQLSDEEMSAVMAAAAPIHPLQRDDFLRSLAAELAQHHTIGPGLVHRLAADLQRRFTVTARAEAEIAARPRHLPERAVQAGR